MSIKGMNEVWASLAEQAAIFRRIGEGSLREGQALEDPPPELAEVLDLLLRSTEQLRREGDSAIRESEDYELISLLLLGAAAVDAMLARDLSIVEPGIDRERVAAELAERDEHLEEEDLGAVFEEGGELLDEVGGLFGPAPGRFVGRSPFPDRPALVRQTNDVTEALVRLATDPATNFAKGLVKVATAASGELLSAVLHLDVITELERKALKLESQGPRFLREHVAKIATLRSDEGIVDELAEKVGSEVENRTIAPVDSLLRFISKPADATTHAEQRIGQAAEITQRQGDELLAGLTDLQTRYADHMDWIGKSALWLRRGARLLVHLGAVAIGPASYAVGAGVFFVGFGYVGYSLTDRLDARNLGLADRVEGVVRLVDRHIPPDGKAGQASVLP